MVFTIEELKQKYKNFSDEKGKISRLVQKGELIPIIKGIYEDNPNINPVYIAPWLYGPSYLSFDYALYTYGLIPEAVYVYTSATYNKRKRKTYNTTFGVYTYQDVPKTAYPYGIVIKVDGAYSFQIATREKALCDKLYTIKPVRNLKEFQYLVFEDLRIDEQDFWNLDLKDLLFLAPFYHSTNLNFLYQFIQKEKKWRTL